jgi:hypothetical protein
VNKSFERGNKNLSVALRRGARDFLRFQGRNLTTEDTVVAACRSLKEL